MTGRVSRRPRQAYLLAPAEAACQECGKPLTPVFGPMQRSLLEEAPELHIGCLERRLARERGTDGGANS